jgi:hypothetical protein
VVFLGSTARHLDKADPKVLGIVDKLMEALSTPAEAVQKAVATCLVPLMPAVKAQVRIYHHAALRVFPVDAVSLTFTHMITCRRASCRSGC